MTTGQHVSGYSSDITINIEVAKVLGITIPPILLARADEVIE